MKRARVDDINITGTASDRILLASPPPVSSLAEIHTLLKRLIYESSEADRLEVENIVSLTGADERPESTFVLLECYLYFENIGDACRALEVVESGVKKAQKTDDQNLQRKAHNIAGAAFSRVCDFESSCFHLERALTIAIKTQNPLFEFATLCNIVSTLQVMGLIREAKELSIRLLRYPEGTEELDFLHLQNAINGLQLSRYAGDPLSVERFNNLARAKLKTAGAVGKAWKAYVDAHHALCLIQQGHSDLASGIIAEAVQEITYEDNLRVKVILLCAKAMCALAQSDADQVKVSRRTLTALLNETRRFALHREDVLRALVELYSTDRSARGRRMGLSYLRQLSDHLVNVKHRQFFQRVNRLLDDDLLQHQITYPFYELPPSLAALEVDGNVIPGMSGKLSTHSICQSRVQAHYFAAPARRAIERKIRSKSYEIAEEWAIAADYPTERTGQHCFQVGRLAGLIASTLGFPDEQALTVEMASRLHDIGKVAIGDVTHKASNVGRIDDYLIIREHTIAGAKLLGASNDPVLRVAARTARHHHEWWNGCGYPDSLRGDSIPIEARVCSIADFYVTLLYPSRNEVAWTEDSAVQQVISMAGVQIDPGLIDPFLAVLEVAKATKEKIPEQFLGDFGLSQVKSSKSQLLKTISTLA